MVPMVVMFAAGLALCGQNPFSLKPSEVARRAQMTPSQQARQILGPTASNDTVVGVADIIAQAEVAQAQAEVAQAQAQVAQAPAQAEVAQAQAEVAQAHRMYLEKEKNRLEKKLLITESRSAAVLCNRFLVETGLLSLYPSSTLTDAYDQFKSNLVQKRRNALTMDIHYPHLVAKGFVCGGRPPAQSMAITMAVCLLQEKQHLHHNAVVVDHEYKPVATLAAGNIGPPP
ncbi:hypothetical protein AK812_SmicGene11291 [Symbiodinium microadriaticum]|uniref:Uncharacterized protein n=1 Tax=Symbiodinium microadriaticum TaxID=2951 RepID=A0A1Q9EDM2_SYMMI|nr:hypothetical protein AK812_SmicGene11291 [Symbiodinium microadriaticum]